MTGRHLKRLLVPWPVNPWPGTGADIGGLGDALEAARRADGSREPSGHRYWLRQGPERVNRDAVDWGREGPNEMLTLNALRVLKAAGRL